VLGVSDDVAEIRAAHARFQAVRCVVSVVDTGVGLRWLVQQAVQRIPRIGGKAADGYEAHEAADDDAEPTSPRVSRRSLAVMAVAVCVLAGFGASRAMSRAESGSTALAVTTQASGAVDAAPPVVAAPVVAAPAADQPFARLLGRMRPAAPAEAAPVGLSYAEWMQQFRARSGVASSPLVPQRGGAAIDAGSGSGRRSRRHRRLS